MSHLSYFIIAPTAPNFIILCRIPIILSIDYLVAGLEIKTTEVKTLLNTSLLKDKTTTQHCISDNINLIIGHLNIKSTDTFHSQIMSVPGHC